MAEIRVAVMQAHHHALGDGVGHLRAGGIVEVDARTAVVGFRKRRKLVANPANIDGGLRRRRITSGR